jgi:hypothetical protein
LCGIRYAKNENPGANIWNEKGYFENYRIQITNDNLLRLAGQDWFSNDKITKEHDDIFNRSCEPLIQVIKEEFSEDLFFIKDPRICFVYPAYTEALNRMGITPYFIWMNRDCEEVAKSLVRRGDAVRFGGMDWGISLCKKYKERFQKLIKDLDNPKVSKISFNDLINDPIAVIKQIEKDFSLKFIFGNEEKIKEFIDPKLKHF